MTKTIGFKVDCEWLCNFVRQRVYWEGLPFTDGLKTIQASFGCSEEIAFDILAGRKKVVGINEGYLEDDDKNSEYVAYLAREEKKKARRELEDDIMIHPLNYFDPFAASWSYKKFCERTVDAGKPVSIEDMKDWFMQPPCEEETDPFLLGGMWSVDSSVAQKIIRNSKDKEDFYEHLYEIVDAWINDDAIPEGFKRRMGIRQRAYQIYKTELGRKEQGSQILMANGQKKVEDENEQKTKKVAHVDYPSWVIDDETNTYTQHNASEAFYQRNAKFIPCPDGVFSEYGIISPTGDFYSCDFAGHKGAAFTIAKQLGLLKGVPEGQFHEFAQDEWELEEELYDSAKDLLFDKGWVFVNTTYGYNAVKDGPFYSQWDRIEDMPQKLMDTCYDWEIWNRNQ